MDLTACVCRALAAAVLTVSAGCVTQDPTSLDGMQFQTARKLALQCYVEREGERFVYGPGQVFHACSQWAQRVVRVQYPQASAWSPSALLPGSK